MPSAHSLSNPSTLSIPHRLEGHSCGPRCSVGARGRTSGRFTVELRLALLRRSTQAKLSSERESTWSAVAHIHRASKGTGLLF